jgi:hypothetical protein
MHRRRGATLRITLEAIARGYGYARGCECDVVQDAPIDALRAS